MLNVLIAGGSGLIGTRLTELLREKGYNIFHLSRSPSSKHVIHWEPDKNFVDDSQLGNFDYVINLSGAGIADTKWTEKRKQQLINSRVASSKLIVEILKKLNVKPQAVISSSAIGYYGAVTTNEVFHENSEAGGDFMAHCCKQWESAIEPVTSMGIRLVKIRTGVVLSTAKGALAKMATPIKYGFGSVLGTGKQHIPWIHIDDICGIFIHAMENDLSGVYNGVGPKSVTNKAFTKALAQRLSRPLWLPNVPGFALKFLLGEMSVIVLEGSAVSAEKICKAGFRFRYEILEDALEQLEI